MAKGKQQPLPGYELSYDHPIEPRFVEGSRPYTDIEVHQFLEMVDELVNQELIEYTARKFASNRDITVNHVVCEDDKRIAGPVTGHLWLHLFDMLGFGEDKVERGEMDFYDLLGFEYGITDAHHKQASAMGETIEPRRYIVAEKEGQTGE